MYKRQTISLTLVFSMSKTFALFFFQGKIQERGGQKGKTLKNRNEENKIKSEKRQISVIGLGK